MMYKYACQRFREPGWIRFWTFVGQGSKEPRFFTEFWPTQPQPSNPRDTPMDPTPKLYMMCRCVCAKADQAVACSPRKHKQTNVWKMRKSQFCAIVPCSCPILDKELFEQNKLLRAELIKAKARPMCFLWLCVAMHGWTHRQNRSTRVGTWLESGLNLNLIDLLNLAGGSGGVESGRAFLTFTHVQRWTQSTSRGKGQFWDALCVSV